MSYGLIFLGVFLALVGLGAIAAGAPSWALGLGLGSSLIQSGSMGLVGGFLLVGIGFVLRALQDLSRRIDSVSANAGAASRAPNPAPAAAVSARPVPKREPMTPPARREPPPFPPREEFPPHDDMDEPPLADGPDHDDFDDPEERRARSWPPSTEPKNPERPSYPGNSDQRRERPRFPVERPAQPGPLDGRGSKPAAAKTAGPNTSTTIVRSGIIGGMAYTLYNDGSIEAELPIGTVRFASVEELQDHVSHTGEDADVDFNDPKSRAN